MSNTDRPQKPAAPTKAAPAGNQGAKPAAIPATEPSLPKSWDDIKVGSLVIAHESFDAGWWEAVVTSITNDILTMRWRDYPRQAPISRSRRQVALLSPGGAKEA